MSAEQLKERLKDSRRAQSACSTRDEADKPTPAVALAAGLEWLLRTEQPDGAICYHLGVVIHAQGGHYASFVPQFGRGPTIIAWDVAKPRRNPNTLALLNPLEGRDVDEVRRELERLGVRVVSSWNGAGAPTVSFAIAEDTHPTLRTAVTRYHQGCTEHKDAGPLCKCGWNTRGYGLLVLPSVDAVAP